MAGPLTPLIPLLPAIGKGLFWTGTAAGTTGGAAAAYDWFSGIGERSRKDIIREGPDSFGDYNVPLHLKPFIDEDSLDDSRNKYVMDTAKKDAEVRQLQRLDPSLQLTNGMTAEDFKDTYAPQIRKIRTKERIDQAAEINNAAYSSPQEIEARRVAAQSRTDALAESRAARADVDRRYLHTINSDNARRAHEASEGKLNRRHQSELADQSNNLQMQMSIMSNDLSEKRMAYDRETRRMDKRSAAIAQLMSGLGSLGGAFAL